MLSGVDPLNDRQQRPAPVGFLSGQAYSQAGAQHGSLQRECIERASLQRGDALGLSHQPMFSHPHAAETECGTSADYSVALSLSHVRCTVKQGARLGQAPTGQDGLGPFDCQGSRWPREGRGVVELNSLGE
jgi:hypothetical protein